MTSAIQRLQSLPAVFRGADLTVRFQWGSAAASGYLYQWKRRGLVAAVGGHSDVFLNHLAKEPPNWDAALLAAMPSALAIGIEALRLAGWTTQIPSKPTVAVDSAQRVFKVDRYDVTKRSPSWYAKVRPGTVGVAEPGLPRLSPAWALADLLKQAPWGACGLHPDDVDWAEASVDDVVQWKDARRAFRLAALPVSLHELGAG